MKKGIIVLLIAVLVSGFAFADVTKFEGSAQVDYVVGLNEGDEFGFKNSQAVTFKFTFEFAADGKTIDEHETDFWAEIAAEASIGYDDVAAKKDITPNNFVAKVTVAKIHLKDFTINILGPKGPYNYAKSFTKATDGNAIFDFANKLNNKATAGTFVFEAGHGIEIQYQGYSVSFAQFKSAAKAAAPDTLGDITYMSLADWAEADQSKYVVVYDAGERGVYVAKIVKHSAKPESLFIYAGAETKAFEFGEGATFKAAANALFAGNKADDKYNLTKKVGAAVKFDYKADKVTAGVAADVDYVAGKIAADILATGGYDFVTAGVYFGLSKPKDGDLEKVLEAYAKAAIPAGDYTINVYAEADRLFHVAKEEDEDMHFDEDWAGFTVKADTTIDKFTVGAYFNYNQVVDTLTFLGEDIDVYGMNFGADVAYAAEKFTVKGGASLWFDDYYDADLKLAAYAVKPYASISTDKVVENCTLSLGWSDARIVILDNEFFKDLFKDNGKITATAKIAF